MPRDSSSVTTLILQEGSALLHIPTAKKEKLAEDIILSSLVSQMFQWHRITNTCSSRRPNYPGGDYLPNDKSLLYSDKLPVDIIMLTYTVLGRWLVQHSASGLLN